MEFPGAGVHLRGPGSGIPGPPRIIIVDNNGHVWERDPGENPLSINDLGQLAGIPVGHSITGMEVVSGPSFTAIYGTSTNGSNSAVIVRIHLDDMTVTQIGGNNGLELPIALAQDVNQNLFTIDIGDDNLYQLDKNTGGATLIGSIGYNANFGQGMFLDPLTGQVINMAYNPVIGDSELRTVDIATGMTTSLGIIEPGIVQQFGYGTAYDRDKVNGIGENGIDGFSMYPNPAQDQITMKATNSIEAIEVYSVLGQMVLNETIKVNNSGVDISHLVTGTYMLKVSTSNQTGIYKLIKQ